MMFLALRFYKSKSVDDQEGSHVAILVTIYFVLINE